MTYVLLNRQIHKTVWYYYVISVYHNPDNATMKQYLSVNNVTKHSTM
jgi:hypothetical protein